MMKGNMQPHKSLDMPQLMNNDQNKYQFSNYSAIQPINGIPKNGADQFMSGINGPIPFNTHMKHSVFDLEDEMRNDEESICEDSRHRRSSSTKSHQAMSSSYASIKPSEKKNSEKIHKNIDINIELEANSSGSEDAFYNQQNHQDNRSHQDNTRIQDKNNSSQNAGLLQKRNHSERREYQSWNGNKKSDSQKYDGKHGKQADHSIEVGLKTQDSSSSKKSGQNQSQIVPVKSAQDKIEQFEQQEQGRQGQSPAQCDNSPKSVSELSSPSKSQSLSDDKDSSSKSGEKSQKRAKIEEEEIQLTQSDQQYIEEIQATYNTDITKLITEDKKEQIQILSELDLYKLQSVKKAITNYEKNLPQQMLVKIQTQISEFQSMLDSHLERAYNGKEKEIELENDNLYLGDNYLDKNKYFEEGSGIFRQIDDVDDNGAIQFNWEPPDKFRAKLYQLDSEGRWHDLGTGYFSIEYKPQGYYQMVLIGEQNRFHNLLENEIIEQRISFHRQRETIITWSDKEREQDLAISFQNNQGALYTWHKICMIIGCDPEQNSQNSENFQEEDNFITVSYETIPKMAEELRALSCMDSQNKNQIADHFLENDCLKLQKLGELYEFCEQKALNNEMLDEKIEEYPHVYLQHFFSIYKGLLLLNDQRLLEVLMTERFYLQAFGALEWDPDALIHEDLSDKKEDVVKKEQEVVSQDSPQDAQESVNEKEFAPDGDIEGDKENIENSAEMKIKTKSVLNYRQFLTKIVKFKKVIPLSYEKKLMGDETESQKPGSVLDNANEKSNSQEDGAVQDNESATQGTQGGHTQVIGILNSQCTIEERIHINYRLQYLKDTVMARYIDDQSVNAISQIVMQNNTKIVQFIFDEDINSDPYNDMIVMKQNSPLIPRKEQRKSIKDQIIDKIQDKEDMNTKAMAIEFMIELCQILKSIQYQNNVGNASNFIYGNNGGSMNNKSLYDQLYQANFIGILAETFAIFTPNKISLSLHQKFENDKTDNNLNELVDFYHKNNFMDPDLIRQMIDIKHGDGIVEEITKLDKMKVNSMEIIISFQTSVHIPITNINSFILGNSQCQKGYPFFDHLVQHLIYSPEQGLKIQIADFFKSIFDQEISQLTSPQNRETLYREILDKFITFLREFHEDFNESKEQEIDQRIFRQYEYSAYLILQIFNKVIETHRYPLTIFINQNQVIQHVANLCTVNSKIINIEIVKFYKAIMRSKVSQYVSMIVLKNLFFPINRIFIQSYNRVNPPMIQSCIRELFEMIFSNYSKTVNEFFNAKLFDYLTHTHQESKEMLKNPEYKDVFGKYDKLNQKDEDDLFFDKDSSKESQVIRENISPIPEKNNSIRPDKNNLTFFAESYQNFSKFEAEDSSDDEVYKADEYKKNDEDIGSLSPIGNPYLKDEIEVNDTIEFGTIISPQIKQNIGKSSASKAWIDDLEENQMIPERSGSQRSSRSLKDEIDGVDLDKDGDSLNKLFNIDCSKSDQIVQERREQQDKFMKGLQNKRKEMEEKGKSSLLASKASSSKSKENFNSGENGIIFERISTSSQGVIDDAELAHDMGIFSGGFELNKKNSDTSNDQKALSPSYGKKQRTNSFDDQDINVEKKPLSGIFTNQAKKSESVKGNTNSLSGIFKNRTIKSSSNQGYGSRRHGDFKELPFSKIKIERGQKQSILEEPPKEDTPIHFDHVHLSGTQSAKKAISQALLDTYPKGTSSPSPNETIKLELTTEDACLEEKSPDEPLVPLSQNRGNQMRQKEESSSQGEDEQKSEGEEPIIEEQNLKRNIQESSILDKEEEEQLKRQKIETEEEK